MQDVGSSRRASGFFHTAYVELLSVSSSFGSSWQHPHLYLWPPCTQLCPLQGEQYDFFGTSCQRLTEKKHGDIRCSQRSSQLALVLSSTTGQGPRNSRTANNSSMADGTKCHPLCAITALWCLLVCGEVSGELAAPGAPSTVSLLPKDLPRRRSSVLWHSGRIHCLAGRQERGTCRGGSHHWVAHFRDSLRKLWRH